MHKLLIVCGVSASGKSTIGQRLAAQLNSPFLEGDDYHPARNITKMQSSTPLADADRAEWVNAMSQSVNTLNETAVLSCSALTPFVQSELARLCLPQITWVKLELSLEIAVARAKARTHFMPPALVQSQFDAWSPPSGGISIDAAQPMNDIIVQIIKALKA